MTGVRYDLEAPSEEFVDDMTKAAQAMQRTADEADDLSNSMELLSIPARKVGAASNEAASGARNAKAAFDGAAQAASAMGGKVGGAAGMVKGLADGALMAGSTLGPVGIAATVVTASVAALTFGVYSAVDSLLSLGRGAVDVRDDIKGFVDDEVLDRLDQLDVKFQHLDLEASILKGTIGSELAPVIGGLVDELVGLETVAEDVVVALGKIKPPDTAAWRALFAIATGGTSELGRQLGEIGQQTEEQLQGSIAQVIGSWEKLKPLVDDHKEAVSDVTDKYLELAKEAEAADKAALAEVSRRLALGEQVTAAMEAEEKRLTAAKAKAAGERWTIWKSELEREMGEAGRMFDALEAQYADDTAAFEKELQKRALLQDAIFGGLIAQVSQLTAQTFGAMFGEITETTAKAVADVEDLISDSNDKIAKWKEEDADKNAALIEQEQAHIVELEDEKKRIQVEAFKQEQALKMGQAAMAGALAIVQAYAQLGPIVATVLTPGIIGMTLMQIETISGQSPPSFHDGGVLHDGGGMAPDEMMFGSARVRSGESAVVFNQRATESGAAERAMAENRQPDEGSREMRLVMADAGRVIGELVAREIRRPGSQIAAFGSSGTRDPYASR